MNLLIAANWKMHHTGEQALAWLDVIEKAVLNQSGSTVLGTALSESGGVEALVCPAFTALPVMTQRLDQRSLPIRLGAQNLHPAAAGSFTGEISAAMLRDAGASYVITGHSERRRYFAETDDTVRRKVIRALASGLVPIVCVGETAEERENDEMEAVLRWQTRAVTEALHGWSQPVELVLAYEPLWAIGSGQPASPEQAAGSMRFIRRQVEAGAGSKVERLRLLYGGSVNPDNLAGFLNQPVIDGALVGGASLDASSYLQLLSVAEQVNGATADS